MLMLNKTKAALQSCQCQNTKLKHPQNSTLIDQVNSGYTQSFVTHYLGIDVENQSSDFSVHQPFNADDPKINSHGEGRMSPLVFSHWTKDNERITKIIAKPKTNNTKIIFFILYPFGSRSRCFSSFLMMRFIQAAKDSSPSCCCAVSIKSRNSGSRRNWNGGLPRLSFLCVDMLSTPDVVCLCVMTHYTHMNEKATPRSAGTLPRRLKGVSIITTTKS